MLEPRQIFFEYSGHKVLSGIEASVEKAEVVSIVGPNGVGKTTLLKCIAGILKPTRGSVRVEGKDIRSMARREIAKQLTYMPQSQPFRFAVTVFDTILSGRRPYFAWRPSRKDLERVERVVEEMGLSHLAMRDMNQLSGGQAQKVLLARALVQDTSHLLLDESNTGLDLRHQLELLETVASLSKGKRVGVVMAMHDLNLAARFSYRIMMLHQGRAFSAGPPAEVITADTIREVYGVESVVVRNSNYLHVQVLRCSGEGYGNWRCTTMDPKAHIPRLHHMGFLVGVFLKTSLVCFQWQRTVKWGSPQFSKLWVLPSAGRQRMQKRGANSPSDLASSGYDQEFLHREQNAHDHGPVLSSMFMIVYMVIPAVFVLMNVFVNMFVAVDM